MCLFNFSKVSNFGNVVKRLSATVVGENTNSGVKITYASLPPVSPTAIVMTPLQGLSAPNISKVLNFGNVVKRLLQRLLVKTCLPAGRHQQRRQPINQSTNQPKFPTSLFRVYWAGDCLFAFSAEFLFLFAPLP